MLTSLNHITSLIHVKQHPPAVLRTSATAHFVPAQLELFRQNGWLRGVIRWLSQWFTPQTQAEMDSLKKTDAMPYGSNMCFTLHLKKLINSRFYEYQTYIFIHFTHLGCEFSSYMRSLPSLNKLMVCLVFLVRFSMKTRKYSFSPRVSILPS